MKLYIAAPFTEWPTAASMRAWLRARRIECTASWIDEAAACNGSEGLAGISDDEIDAIAQRNDADVLAVHAEYRALLATPAAVPCVDCGSTKGDCNPDYEGAGDCDIDPDCICGEINARHCPVHNEPAAEGKGGPDA